MTIDKWSDKVASPRHRPPLPQELFLVNMLEAKLTTRSNEAIGNRTRSFPVCSAVPQTTAPPRAPLLFNFALEYAISSFHVNQVGFKLKWYTLASGLCWWCLYIGRKRKYCKESRRSSALLALQVNEVKCGKCYIGYHKTNNDLLENRNGNENVSEIRWYKIFVKV